MNSEDLYITHTQWCCCGDTEDYYLLSYEETEQGIIKITYKLIERLGPSLLSLRLRTKMTKYAPRTCYNYPEASGVWRDARSLNKINGRAAEILNEWKTQYNLAKKLGRDVEKGWELDSANH